MNARTITDLLHAYRQAEPGKLASLRVVLGDALEEAGDVREEVVRTYEVRKWPPNAFGPLWYVHPGGDIAGKAHSIIELAEEEIRRRILDLFPEMRPVYGPSPLAKAYKSFAVMQDIYDFSLSRYYW